METETLSSNSALTNSERDLKIRLDVRELALQHKDSRRLSREVCRLLFYRYGETPNANRIYSLTRKGSLTTISEEVASFWQSLREQTQVHIPCPGLTADAAERMGSFLTGLIADIEQRLNGELDVHRQAAQDEVRLVRLELQSVREASAALQEAAHRQKIELQERLTSAQDQIAGLQQQLARETATSALLRDETQAWERRAVAAQSQAQETQALFAQEVANLGEALAAAEARASGAEQHALDRIEKEKKAGRLLAEKLHHQEKAFQAQRLQLESLNQVHLKVSEEAAELRGKLKGLQAERDNLVRLQPGSESGVKLRLPASRRKR